tara:strand:- start:2669 stop:3361 length:693 start_codon:yes stop_codon:yes gene_type:complete
MLALSQKLSLSSLKKTGGASAWTPTDDASLEAWYQNSVGITLNGSDVSSWADSSTNTFDMLQAIVAEQPSYNALNGELTFASAYINNLQASSQIDLLGEYTFGIRMFPTATGVVVVGSNTSPLEFVKIMNTTDVRVSDGVGQIDITLDSGSFLADMTFVITRDAANLTTLYINGVAQADTETLTGAIELDAIGVRRIDKNPYDGVIKEIQIYTSTSATLTANVIARLASL